MHDEPVTKKLTPQTAQISIDELSADVRELTELVRNLRQSRARLLTVSDVAEYLQLSTRTVERRIARGDLNPMRIGGVRRFSKEQIDAYLRRSIKR